MAARKTSDEDILKAGRPVRGISESAADHKKRLDAYVRARNAAIKAEGKEAANG